MKVYNFFVNYKLTAIVPKLLFIIRRHSMKGYARLFLFFVDRAGKVLWIHLNKIVLRFRGILYIGQYWEVWVNVGFSKSIIMMIRRNSKLSYKEALNLAKISARSNILWESFINILQTIRYLSMKRGTWRKDSAIWITMWMTCFTTENWLTPWSFKT